MIISHFKPVIFNPSLLSGNLLFSWGRDIYGRLGINKSDPTYFADSPVKISPNQKWKEIAAGPVCSLAIKNDGTLWSWGRNTNSMLGIGSGTSSITISSPVQVGSDSTWKSVKAAGGHILALKEDGSLWAWGNGASGRLGLGSTGSRSAPARIGLLSDWSSIAVGGNQSLAIKTDGSLWAWGSNNNGQLGLGDKIDRSSPVQVGLLQDWSFVSGGDNFSLAIKTDGTLWAWGSGIQGRLGTGSSADRSSPVQVGLLSDWSFIDSGNGHSFAIKTDGTLWAWGANGSWGALGDETTTNRSSPVPIGSGSTWKYASAGVRHSVAIRSDGTMWAWGNNAGARLGVSIMPYMRSPIAIANDQSWDKNKVFSCGSESFFAINSDNKLVVFGYNGLGNLGLGDTVNRSSPVLVNNDSWSYVSSWDHTLAVKTEGTLWAWGEVAFGKTGVNSPGSLIFGRSSPIQVGLLSDWVSVSAGDNHSLAIKTDGTLWSWGRNNSGQLGVSGTADRSSPVQVGLLSDWVSVSAGSVHSLAVKTDGTLWAWGGNTYGILGLSLSASSTRSSPVQVGASSNWSSASAGSAHSLAIKADGTLWAWGRGNYGQTGLRTVANMSSPVQVGLLSDWQSVSAGRAITAAIKTDGTLWSWGYNEDGRLGINSIYNMSSPVQVGNLTSWSAVKCSRNLMAITNDNKIYGAGPGSSGSLIIKTIVNISSPIQINAGSGWKKVSAYTSNLGIK